MFPKKRNNETKTSSNSNLKHQGMSKSISLIINPNHLSTSNISKKLQPNQAKKSSSVEKISKKNLKLNRNDKNKKSAKLYNLSLPRQNSQGSFYTQKNYINDEQFTNINLKYQKLNSHLLSEAKAPKLIELINNKIKKKKTYLETHNSNLNKVNNYNKSNSSLSLVHKKKNLTQGNLEYINFDEICGYNIFKSSRNSKIMNKKTKKSSQDYNNHRTNKNMTNRYDKNKCVIERKIYKGDKPIKKNKSIESKTTSNNYENTYNRMLYNNIKLNLNKEHALNELKKEKNISNTNSIKNLDINLTNTHNNNRYSSYKLLNKSQSNSNLLNTSLEDLTQSNKNDNNNGNNNNEIKLIFPSFINNKCDINNESSQDTTNLVGSLNSNKYTINNSNIGYRKEKFISSFLDGPEDIHCRFVELHRQRKMFYENLSNKLEEDGNSIDINKANMSEFDKSEYSEYFDNYNENVPLI